MQPASADRGCRFFYLPAGFLSGRPLQKAEAFSCARLKIHVKYKEQAENEKTRKTGKMMRKKIRKAGLAAAVCFILAVSGFVSGCSGAQTSPETGQESEEQEAPAGENGAEENAQVVDQSTESVSRYAGVYKARRDMRKALNLTLPGGTDLVRTKVKLTYVLTLREDGSFDLETEDGDEAFLAAKREATIEIVRSIQAGKLKEAGYSEEQFDEVAGISGFADFEDMVVSTAEKQMEESRSATSYTLSGTFRTQDRLILMTGKNAAGEEENMTLRVRRDGNLNLPLGEQHLMFRKQEEE